MSVKPKRPPPQQQADPALEDSADVPWGPPEPSPREDDEIPTVLYDVPAEELRQDFSPAFLSVEVGPGSGQLLELFQGTVVIGRASVADLRIQHPSISRRHVEVHRVGERFFIEDLGSQNGTFVNKVRISGRREIRPMDALSLGHALVRLRGPSSPSSPADRRRSAPLARKTDTAVMARAELSAAAGRSGTLTIGILAGAIGFALAGGIALALTLTRAVATEAAAPVASPPSLPLPTAAPARPEAVSAAAPVAPPTPSQPEEPALTSAPLAPALRPPALVARSSPGLPAKSATDHLPPTPARTRAPPSRSQALQAYERGDAEAALRSARLAQDQDLAARLSGFLEAYAAGKRARAAHDLQGALFGFTKALAFDEQLSSGWGKYGVELRRELASLHVAAGKQSEIKGDPQAAQQAYEAALLDDPGNEAATAGLGRVASRSAKSPDEAFEEANVRAEPEAKKAAAQRIEEAFGE